MASAPLRSFSQHLNDAWALYARHFWSYIGMMLVSILGLLPLIAVVAGFGAASLFFGANGGDAATAQAVNVTLGAVGIAAAVFGLYLMILAQIGGLVQIKQFAAGDVRSVYSYLKEGNGYFFSFLGMSILVVLIAIPAFLALIIPGLIFVVYVTFAQWALVYENAGAWGAVKRSFQLVSGNFWRVIGRWYLPLILFYIIISGPQFFMAEGSAPFAIYELISGIASFALAPFVNIYLYILYRDILTAKSARPAA